jgi:phosphoglycolate phosphatase
VIKVVILDFDDTLFMTEEVTFRLENAAGAMLGLPPMDRDVHLKTWGMTVEQALPARFQGADLQAYLRAHGKMVSQYVSSGQLDQLSRENVEALTWLNESGYKLFSVTSRDVREISHFLDGSHILMRHLQPDAIFHKGNNYFHKPDPRAFDGVVALSGAQPGECVYVGDSLTDCQAAKGAGLQFVACLESGLRRREDFAGLASPPDGFIDTFADVVDWLSHSSLDR